MTARAFHRGYRSERTWRLHLLRDTEPAPRTTSRLRGPRTPQGWCGTHAWDVTDSTVVWIDPAPETPPAGMTWCPGCIGRYAERIGILDRIAAAVIAADEEAHVGG